MRRGRTPAAWRPYSEQEALALSPAGVAAAIAAACADADEGDPQQVPAAGPCLTAGAANCHKPANPITIPFNAISKEQVVFGCLRCTTRCGAKGAACAVERRVMARSGALPMQEEHATCLHGCECERCYEL